MIETPDNIPTENRLDPAATDVRQRAMVAAGTHPMIADRLARDAARGQALRDARLKLTAAMVREPVLATEPVVVTQTVPVDPVEPTPDLFS